MRSLEILGTPTAPLGVPAWAGGAVPSVASSSSAAAQLTTKLEDELRSLASRVDGSIRKEITRAADDARLAAEEARGAQQATRILHGELRKVQDELSGRLLQLPTDVADLRRQLHEHVEWHQHPKARSATKRTQRKS